MSASPASSGYGIMDARKIKTNIIIYNRSLIKIKMTNKMFNTLQNATSLIMNAIRKCAFKNIGFPQQKKLHFLQQNTTIIRLVDSYLYISKTANCLQANKTG